jgi:hypothetical protein
MTFEQRMGKLCKDAVASESEQEAVEILRQMQELMHNRIEELRGNLITLPPVGPTTIRKQSA